MIIQKISLLLCTALLSTGTSAIWVWTGGLRSDSIVISVGDEGFSFAGSKSVSVDLVLSTFEESSTEQSTEMMHTVLKCNSLPCKIQVTQLEPEQVYGGVVTLNNQRSSFQFTTPSAEGNRMSFSFVMGSCASTGSEAAVFQHIATIEDVDPLFVLHMGGFVCCGIAFSILTLEKGDLHYEDIKENNISLFASGYAQALNSSS